MGKHRFLTYDKSNKGGGDEGETPKSKKFSGTRNKFRNPNNKFRNGNTFSHCDNRPLEPTPWLKLKEAFLEQEKDIEEKKKCLMEDQAEKKAFLEARSKTYKKFLAQEKRKEETVWEDFSSETADPDTSKKHQKKFKNQDFNSNPNQLSEKSKDHLKKIITKDNFLKKGGNLDSMCFDLKKSFGRKKTV